MHGCLIGGTLIHLEEYVVFADRFPMSEEHDVVAIFAQVLHSLAIGVDGRIEVGRGPTDETIAVADEFIGVQERRNIVGERLLVHLAGNARCAVEEFNGVLGRRPHIVEIDGVTLGEGEVFVEQLVDAVALARAISLGVPAREDIAITREHDLAIHVEDVRQANFDAEDLGDRTGQRAGCKLRVIVATSIVEGDGIGDRPEDGREGLRQRPEFAILDQLQQCFGGERLTRVGNAPFHETIAFVRHGAHDVDGR